MEKLPERFVIERDETNPLWEKLEEWVYNKFHLTMARESKGQGGSWGYLFEAYSTKTCSSSEIFQTPLLTLEAWDEIVNKKEEKSLNKKEFYNAKREEGKIEAVLNPDYKTPEEEDMYLSIDERMRKVLRAKSNDPVNSPDHYTSGGIETIDFIEAKGLDFCTANAVKYISRAGKKSKEKEVEDLEKAVWYLNRKIKRLKG
jgi:hypothetical protein